MDAGKRDALLIFERATVVVDNDGIETPTWALYTTAWAQVRRGTGQERREAAQEGGTQTATFVCDWNPTLEAVGIKDRIDYREDAWDILDVAPDGNREIQFTAARVT